MDLPDRLRVQPGALVGQVVAADTGDRRVPQAHLLHRLRHPERLAGVEVSGLAGVDLAEVAAAGALVAADQEGGLAVLPALEDVGATGFLADRVQALALHQLLQVAILRAHPGGGLDPGRLLLDRHTRVAHLESEQPAAFRGDGHRVSLPRPRHLGLSGGRGGQVTSRRRKTSPVTTTSTPTTATQ